MDLVDIVFPSFLGNEQHLFEEEECACVLRPQDMKGALQHQLSIGGQVRTLPVDQKRLYLLQMYMKAHTPKTHTLSHVPSALKKINASQVSAFISNPYKTHVQRKPGR